MTEVRLTPVKHIEVHLGGAKIVDTTRGYVVHEGSLPPRYYVPREDVEAQLTDSTGGKCPWKGTWKHLDLEAHGKQVKHAAWTYFETTPVCDPIRDFIAFYPNQVDKLVVD